MLTLVSSCTKSSDVLVVTSTSTSRTDLLRNSLSQFRLRSADSRDRNKSGQTVYIKDTDHAICALQFFYFSLVSLSIISFSISYDETSIQFGL